MRALRARCRSFEIDVASGERVDRGEDGGRDEDAPRLKPRRWRAPPQPMAGGRRQRTHDVRVVDGGVYVRLRTGGEVDSDAYAHRFLGAALDW